MTELKIGESPIHQIALDSSRHSIYIKRDDLLHPIYGGNKWRKLKYNLEFMQANDLREMVTFGGPFSNHIYAAAGVAKNFNVHVTAYIRGEVDDPQNPVLIAARDCGVQLVPLSRAEFAKRNEHDFITELQSNHADAHVVPEGGTNVHALRGCAEIVTEVEQQLGFLPDYWIVPGGTGGTAVGVAEGLAGRSHLHVVTALPQVVFNKTFIPALEWTVMADRAKIRIDDRYSFGGLARWNENLLQSMDHVEKEHGIVLDPLYTGKAWYGMEQMRDSGEIPKAASILMLHTGGQAGRACFNYRYGNILAG